MTQTNNQPKSLMSIPKEYMEQETTSCVITGCVIVNPELISEYLAIGVQSYNDSGEETTIMLIVPKGNSPIDISKIDMKHWYKNKTFANDVLEEIWQNWKELSNPDDELDNFDETNSDSVYLEYKGHLGYKEQEMILTELFRDYLKTQIQ